LITATQVVDLALSQEGDRYIFGVEVSPDLLNPGAFDCSELVQWIGARLGIRPAVPDGSWIQWQHAKRHGTLIGVTHATETKGALLFRFGSPPESRARPTSAHVAISQGNGRTIEARSTRYGVGQFPTANRGWTHASLIPGVTYTKEAPIKVADPTAPSDWAREAWDWAISGPDPIVRGSHPRQTATIEQVITYLHRARGQ
jgi:hypothetical protein